MRFKYIGKVLISGLIVIIESDIFFKQLSTSIVNYLNDCESLKIQFMSHLMSPLSINGVNLKNRVVMSPMCQYAAYDGMMNDWHFVHYATRAIGGCGAIIQEATAVTPEGRISYRDLGIWDDMFIKKLRNITSIIEKYGAVPGIELAHAGRKASCETPYNGGKQMQNCEHSWIPVAPSPIPFREEDVVPHELTEKEIDEIITAFIAGAERAMAAGYKIIEIHAAHGYLINEFLSTLTNHRTDRYGGSFENRIRILTRIIEGVRPLIDYNHSLWVRISATNWSDEGWDIEQSVRLVKILKTMGVDVIDVSTGGNIPNVNIPVAPGYQVQFSEQIKKETGMITGAVGLITEAEQAEEILRSNKSDLIFLGRELLRNPYFANEASLKLNDKNILPYRYSWWK